MNSEELASWMRQHKVGEVACLVPDFSGTARGKSMTPSLFLEAVSANSLRLPEGAYTISVFGEFVYNKHIDRSERDLTLVPDLSTLHLAPWTKDNTACVICDSVNGAQMPFDLAPRQTLKNVLALYEKRGWEPIIGPEVEFYLIDQFQGMITEPRAPTGDGRLPEFGQHTYSLDAIDEFDQFFEDLYDFSELQGISLDTLIHEDGPCQFEVNLSHRDALRIADQLFLFKRLARHVAKKYGAFATFMAKPYADECGSSIHLHQSVVNKETGENIFADEDGADSDLFRWYIGGLQKYLPEAMPLFAPYTNSYNRFEAYMSAPTNVHWSRDNRTVGLRVPESPPAARRIENRISGSDVNPYFAIAASLICGYIGMENKIERKNEFIGQSYEDDTRALPNTMTEALFAFESSEQLRAYLGDPLIDTFTDIKRAEHDHRSSVLSPWDVRFLMVNI